jgi:hypothetical protein
MGPGPAIVSLCNKPGASHNGANEKTGRTPPGMLIAMAVLAATTLLAWSLRLVIAEE